MDFTLPPLDSSLASLQAHSAYYYHNSPVDAVASTSRSRSRPTALTSSSSSSAAAAAADVAYSDWVHPDASSAYDLNEYYVHYSNTLAPSFTPSMPPPSSSSLLPVPESRYYEGPAFSGNTGDRPQGSRQTRQHSNRASLPTLAADVPAFQGPQRLGDVSTASSTGRVTRARNQQIANMSNDLQQPQYSVVSSSAAAQHALPATVPTRSSAQALGGAQPLPQYDGVGTRTRRATGNASKNPPPTEGSTALPKTPHQAEESSVPEAALHLLRLALPSGSTGSAATNTTIDDDDDDDASGEDDPDIESDATSVHSGDIFGSVRDGKKRQSGRRSQRSSGDSSHLGYPIAPLPLPLQQTGELSLRTWQHADGLPPLHFPIGLPRPGSVASSMASVRTRSHVPARAQREQSAASTRAGSETAWSPIDGASGWNSNASGRRTSGRIRKSIVPDPAALIDSDHSASEADDGRDKDAVVFDESDSDAEGRGSRRASSQSAAKGKSRAGPSSVASSSSRKVPAKRVSTGGAAPTSSKKSRTSVSGGGDNDDAVSTTSSSSSRRPRRAPVAPTNLVMRTLPSAIPIHPGFSRFYRAFPISAAFPPDSYVHQSAMSLGSTSSSSARTRTSPDSLELYVQPPHQTMLDPYGLSSSFQHQMAPQVGSSVYCALSNPTHGFMDPPQLPQISQPHTRSLGAPPPLPQLSQAPRQTSQPSPSQQQQQLDDPARWFLQPPEGAKWNKATDPLNLYTTRFVKGNAGDKCGLCPICIEPVARGGSGEEKWLKVCRVLTTCRFVD